jgi:hypothetical protein
MIKRFHPWPMAILISLALWVGIILWVLWITDIIA